MALKVLMLRKKLEDKQKELKDLERKDAAFETREKELEADIEEAVTDEERSAVDTEIAAFETERSAHTEALTRVRGEIELLTKDIEDAEKAVKEARSAPPAGSGTAERKDNIIMDNAEKRHRVLGMTTRELDVLMAREDIKTFIARAREYRAQNRSVSGAELGVPEILLGVLRDNTNRYSKLIGRINVKPLKGKARQNIAGSVPEAIWTEAVGALNELDIVFTQMEMDGYKVAGYLAIPNSTLEDDSDLELLSTIMDQLGQAIGYAVDKAIIYGTGAKMPVGFVTRLAAAAQPNWWGTNQGEFTDLHSSNVLKLNLASTTGAAFFGDLIRALGVAKPNYSSNGQLTWVMNRKTHIDLLSRCLAFDLNAALIAGMQNTMPVLGGEIIELEFMANYDIGGGYLDLMRFVERAGASIGSSDQPLFIQDQTVFKGTQRYDGKPARGEAFVLVNYNNVNPTTSVIFGFDYANTDIGTLIVTTAAGATSGKTAVSVAGNTSGATLKYKLAGTPIIVKAGAKLDKWSTLDTGTEVAASTGNYITVIEVDANGKAVKSGSGVVTAKA